MDELEYTIAVMTGKHKSIPTIEELKREYFGGAVFPMEVSVIARWYGDKDHELAPNGVRELLAWLLIMIDEIKRLKAKIAELDQPTAAEGE